jgi:hypothetical protein
MHVPLQRSLQVVSSIHSERARPQPPAEMTRKKEGIWS